MPKIIDKAYYKILTVAKRKMLEEGYSSLSLRSIAKECEVAVGTIYNYFENKDMLIAMIMLDDWKCVLNHIDEDFKANPIIEEGIILIYHHIKTFVQQYNDLFNQYSLVRGSTKTVKKNHPMLIDQIIEKINHLLINNQAQEDTDLAPILAEMILTASMHDSIEEHQLIKIIRRIF